MNKRPGNKKGPPKIGEMRPLTTGERLAVKQGDVKLWILHNSKGNLWIMENVEDADTGEVYGHELSDDSGATEHVQLTMLESLAEYWRSSEGYTHWYGFRMSETQWEYLQQQSIGGSVAEGLRYIIDASAAPVGSGH